MFYYYASAHTSRNCERIAHNCTTALCSENVCRRMRKRDELYASGTTSELRKNCTSIHLCMSWSDGDYFSYMNKCKQLPPSLYREYHNNNNNFFATRYVRNPRPIATNSQKWNFVEEKERKIVKNLQLQLRHISWLEKQTVKSIGNAWHISTQQKHIILRLHSFCFIAVTSWRWLFGVYVADIVDVVEQSEHWLSKWEKCWIDKVWKNVYLRLHGEQVVNEQAKGKQYLSTTKMFFAGKFKIPSLKLFHNSKPYHRLS